jgi:hypothetical protein
LDFSTVLLRESDEIALPDDSFYDLKKRLLQKLHKQKEPYKNIFAYRDRGKMFVFDK